MRTVWQGMRLMSGYSKGSSKSSQIPNITERYANDLDVFYNRFDKHNFTGEIKDLKLALSGKNEQICCTTEDEVRRLFAKLDPSKAGGPDMITARVLKECSSQLAYIFKTIFNLSFSLRCIPDIWKRSCIIPVPKKSVVSCMNDVRPVALTSIPMKCCERIVLNQILPLVTPFLDPFQFAYQQGPILVYFIHCTWTL